MQMLLLVPTTNCSLAGHFISLSRVLIIDCARIAQHTDLNQSTLLLGLEMLFCECLLCFENM